MREHTSSADWLRNGVATWSGSAYLFDSRRPRPIPSRAKSDPESDASEPVPAPVKAVHGESSSDRMVVYATQNEFNDWSQGEWLLSGQQSAPRRVSGLDGSGNGWGIEFGTGRRVRMQHWRFVGE
ncbi:MAG TPA: hypothetical protein VK191_08305 [Symbiobacteriaceae bacterium]|nr:hypothetical protein [Symbiobacteriaceae bacterium]